jgi:hypothetical protein
MWLWGISKAFKKEVKSKPRKSLLASLLSPCLLHSIAALTGDHLLFARGKEKRCKRDTKRKETQTPIGGYSLYNFLNDVQPVIKPSVNGNVRRGRWMGERRR